MNESLKKEEERKTKFDVFIFCYFLIQTDTSWSCMTEIALCKQLALMYLNTFMKCKCFIKSNFWISVHMCGVQRQQQLQVFNAEFSALPPPETAAVLDK